MEHAQDPDGGEPGSDPGPGHGFATTRWTWVEAAGGAESERARLALAELCQIYWYPLYAFVRRLGVPESEAQDVVQDFFARLIEKRGLARVTRGHGRFRSFLRVAVRNHLANLRDRERAARRGGGRVRLEIDADGAAERFARDPASDASPDRAFDRVWALELMATCQRALEADYAGSGRGEVFRVLRPLLKPGAGASLARAAAELGMAEGATRVALHRLRTRFRDRLRQEIARTVSTEAEIEQELLDLFRAVGSPGDPGPGL